MSTLPDFEFYMLIYGNANDLSFPRELPVRQHVFVFACLLTSFIIRKEKTVATPNKKALYIGNEWLCISWTYIID